MSKSQARRALSYGTFTMLVSCHNITVTMSRLNSLRFFLRRLSFILLLLAYKLSIIAPIAACNFVDRSTVPLKQPCHPCTDAVRAWLHGFSQKTAMKAQLTLEPSPFGKRGIHDIIVPMRTWNLCTSEAVVIKENNRRRRGK
jgi:hypothetical protein